MTIEVRIAFTKVDQYKLFSSEISLKVHNYFHNVQQQLIF